MAGAPADFRGIFVARKDSGLRQPADLKGKAVSYPSPTALAACIMPQRFLQDHGINVNADIQNRYVGSQESSIMNVLLGHVAAGATWPVPWKTFQQENPEMAAQLEVKWQTGTLPNNGWVARGDVPNALVDAVGKALVRLNSTQEGRALLEKLGITSFEHASNATYKPVQQYLMIFSETVRPIDY